MIRRFRGRLFWKILFGFWLVFLLISQLLWLGFTLYDKNHRESPESIAVRHIVDVQMASAASVLKNSGFAALHAMMAAWSPDDRRFFSVEPLTMLQQEKIALPMNREREHGGMPHTVAEQVTGADGRQYLLRYDVTGLRIDSDMDGHRRSFLNIPQPMFILAGLAGLLFSALLAWNLTRPMRQLREGFAKVSGGDLSVRLYPAMRRRHDELSIVARDFDAMVERLIVLVRAREELLHDISHELRSPLARLQLATGLARQTPESVGASLDRIDEEASRLDKMIGELLTLSRAENDTMPEEQYVDLSGLLEVVVNDARFEAQIPGVEILLDVTPAADYTVKGHAELIRRAIENIVRNALRFSLQGQQINVSLRQENVWLVISVSDQGPGVDDDKLSSIFDPFVRVNSPLMGRGYGLGLSIVRKVILAHNGDVQAKNNKEGGLSLTVRLPHWQGK